MGGLWLGSAIAILSILACFSETQAAGIKQGEVVNLFNNVCWRIIANNAIVDANKDNWITEEEYRESIIKVIGQAIADCITEKEEFANKKATDVITFAVTPKDTPYSPKHWNAVILFNYLHESKEADKIGHNMTAEYLFDQVHRKVLAHYRDNYQIEDVESKRFVEP